MMPQQMSSPPGTPPVPSVRLPGFENIWVSEAP